MKNFISKNYCLLIVCLSTATGYSAEKLLPEDSKKKPSNTWKIQTFTPFEQNGLQTAHYTEQKESNNVLNIERLIEKGKGQSLNISGTVIEPTFENPNPFERARDTILEVNKLLAHILMQDRKLLAQVNKCI